MRKPLGYVIQESTSPIDGSPIVVILTMGSSNRKTGNMCQVWILRADVNPVQAVNTGEDYSICGNCPHRKQATGPDPVMSTLAKHLIAFGRRIRQANTSAICTS